MENCHESLSQRLNITHLAALGKELGAKVIAERIEKAEELEALQKARVPFGQGFLLGHPEQFSKT